MASDSESDANPSFVVVVDDSSSPDGNDPAASPKSYLQANNNNNDPNATTAPTTSKDLNDRESSFESSTAVIDEAEQTAAMLQSMETTAETEAMFPEDEAQQTSSTKPRPIEATVIEMETAPAEDGEPITIEEAIALWKRLGTGATTSDGGSLERGKSLFDAGEALVGAHNDDERGRQPLESFASLASPMFSIEEDREGDPGGVVRITITDDKDGTPSPPKDFFEAALDSVGMDKMCGLDEAALEKQLARRTIVQVASPKLPIPTSNGGDVLERVLNSLGVGDMCGATTEATTSSSTTSPSNPIDPSPVTVRGTDDIFANEAFARKKATFSYSDVFPNEYPTSNDGGGNFRSELSKLLEATPLASTEIRTKVQTQQLVHTPAVVTPNKETSGYTPPETIRGKDDVAANHLLFEPSEATHLSSMGVPTKTQARQTEHTPAMVTPTNETSDYPFPERILGKDDIFDNHLALPEHGGYSSRDVFSNEFAADEGTLDGRFWNKLLGLCEPLELQLPHRALPQATTEGSLVPEEAEIHSTVAQQAPSTTSIVRT